MSNETKHYKDDKLGIEFDYNDPWYVTDERGNYDIMVRALPGKTYESEYVGIIVEENTSKELDDEAERIYNKWKDKEGYSSLDRIRDDSVTKFGLPSRLLEVVGEVNGERHKAQVYMTISNKKFIRVDYHGRFPEQGEIHFDKYSKDANAIIESIKFNWIQNK